MSRPESEYAGADGRCASPIADGPAELSTLRSSRRPAIEYDGASGCRLSATIDGMNAGPGPALAVEPSALCRQSRLESEYAGAMANRPVVPVRPPTGVERSSVDPTTT